MEIQIINTPGENWYGINFSKYEFSFKYNNNY